VISINQNALAIVRKLIENAEAYGCRYIHEAGGAHVLDMGFTVPGSWEAARLFTEINMAGLGRCSFRNYDLNEQISFPAIEIYADNPILACLVSQSAGLQVSSGDSGALCSGPGQALVGDLNSHGSEQSDYRDASHEAVLAIQIPSMPNKALIEAIAAQCGVPTEGLYLLVHPSASIVASVQVAGRILEQTMNKMIRNQFDLSQIRFASGYCVVAPVIEDELEAMGRINDSLLYGGKASFWVNASDEEIERVLPRLVTESCSRYGELFIDLYRESGMDFGKMDPDIHSPAEVQISNMNSGKTFHAGGIRKDLLLKSFTASV
jgi:methenyltetrahydromethanopterin cyclohydrolase